MAEPTGTLVIEVYGRMGEVLSEHCCTKTITESDMVDRFKILVTGNGPHAMVRREVMETIGGPGFSSIKVGTSIEVPCDPTVEKITAALDAALMECIQQNSEAVHIADGVLRQDIDRLNAEREAR